MIYNDRYSTDIQLIKQSLTKMKTYEIEKDARENEREMSDLERES